MYVSCVSEVSPCVALYQRSTAWILPSAWYSSRRAWTNASFSFSSTFERGWSTARSFICGFGSGADWQAASSRATARTFRMPSHASRVSGRAPSVYCPSFLRKSALRAPGFPFPFRSFIA